LKVELHQLKGLQPKIKNQQVQLHALSIQLEETAGLAEEKQSIINELRQQLRVLRDEAIDRISFENLAETIVSNVKDAVDGESIETILKENFSKMRIYLRRTGDIDRRRGELEVKNLNKRKLSILKQERQNYVRMLKTIKTSMINRQN